MHPSLRRLSSGIPALGLALVLALLPTVPVQAQAGARSTPLTQTQGTMMHSLTTVDEPARSSASRETSAPESIRPFKAHATDAELADLRHRIKAMRWPDHEIVADQSQGVQLATMQKLAHYWATDYDWRKVEARLNALPQFVTTIDGVDIHFIHVRSKEKKALPDDHHPRVAGLGDRATEDRRSADQSDRSWRRGRGRLRRRHSFAARLRILGQARRHRAGIRFALRRRGSC